MDRTADRIVAFDLLHLAWGYPGDGVPSGAAFPESPEDGDRFRLLRPETVHNNPVAHMTFGQDTAGNDRVLSIPLSQRPNGPVQIIAYASDWDGTNTAQEAALRGKVFVQYAGTATPLLAEVVLYQDGADEAEYAQSQTALTTAGLTHLYEIPTLSFASLASGLWRRNGIYADGSKLFPDAQDLIGEYTYNSLTGWVLTPGVYQPPVRQLFAITKLHDGSGIGLSVPTPATAVRDTLRLFTPAFDIDDPDKQSGTLVVRAQVSIATPAAPSAYGFKSSSATNNPRKSVTVRETLFVSELRAAGAEYSASADMGVQIGDDIEVFNGTTSAGFIKVYLARNANNVLGYFLSHPAGGTSNLAFSVGLDLEVSFQHNDQSQAASIPVYTSLSGLPSAASMEPGTRAEVIESASPFAAMSFAVDGRASGSRRWQCVGGTSGDLVGSAGIRVPTSQGGVLVSNQWYQIITGSNPTTYAEWDNRFPVFLVNFGGAGGPANAPWWYAAQWFTFDAASIFALGAGVANQDSSASGQFLEVTVYQLDQTVSNDVRAAFRRIRIGRTSTNRILVASATRAGTQAPNPPHISPFRVRGTS